MYQQAMANIPAPSAAHPLENYSIPAELAQEKGVVLIHGNNLFGDKVFSYVEITLEKFRDLKIAMDKNQNFKPADFGTVLAAGRGEPSAELKAEMEGEHQLMDIPMPKAQRPVIKPAPRFSFDDED